MRTDLPTDLLEGATSAEPLTLSESGPHWAHAAQQADRLRALDCEIAKMAWAQDAAALALREEVEASFLIEAEVADADAIARMIAATTILRGAPYLAPEALCRAHAELMRPEGGARPGFFRDHFVQVGRHVAVSPGAVRRCLEHASRGYGRAGRAERLIGAAAGHHRLSWIHPFSDGNGRIARAALRVRLMEELPGAGAWSLSPILLERQGDYLRAMAGADEPRRGDRDGRGNLSEANLASLVTFLLGCMEEAMTRAVERLSG